MAERHQAEEKRSLKLVPHIQVNPAELVRLERSLQEANQAIVALREYAAQMRTGPAPQLSERADRLEKLLASMKLASVPIFQERFENEIIAIRQGIGLARRVESGKTLDATEEQIRMLGTVFEYEVKIIRGGLPETYRLGDRTPEQTFIVVQDAAENAVLAIGTKHDRVARKILAGVKLLAENFDGYVFEDPNTVEEYRALTQFVHERHAQMGTTQIYTPQQESADEQALQSFEHNLAEIKRQARENSIAFLSSLAEAVPNREVAKALGEVATDQYHRLREDAERVMTRMRGGGELATYDEMSNIISGHLALSGIVEDQISLEELKQNAKTLRGSGKVKEDTPEWFGLLALKAIENGNRPLAALAVSVGNLDRQTFDRLAEYLPSCLEMISAIKNGMRLTPSMQARFYGEVEYANIRVETEQLVRNAGTGEKWERVKAAAATILQRLSEGKIEEAKQLLAMAGTYLNMLRVSKWKSWYGSGDMEEAIDSEIAGVSAFEKFNRSLVYHQFKLDSNRLKVAWSDWGSGMIMQRKVVRESLEYAEELAKQGRGQDAARVLTLITMYVDAIETNSTRKASQVYSLVKSDGPVMRGMERALGAIAKGEQQIDGVDVDTLFATSFYEAKNLYIKREAARLEALAAARPIGRETIMEAIQAAKARAARKDFDGAAMLLVLAGDFYGREIPASPADAVKAAKEGWQYAMYAVSNTLAGRQLMLQAIRLEMGAKTATQHNTVIGQFREGMTLVGRSYELTLEYQRIAARYRGDEPFQKGTPKGKVLAGKDGDGKEVYIALDAVKIVDEKEGRNPTSPALEAGRTLKEILRDIEMAAAKGDVDAYNLAVTAFNRRFNEVVLATTKSQMYAGMAQSLGQLQNATADLFRFYDDVPRLEVGTRKINRYEWRDGVVVRNEFIENPRHTALYYGKVNVPSRIAQRIGALEQQRLELIDKIQQIQQKGGDGSRIIVAYNNLMADFRKEERLASAYTDINGQLKANPQYRAMVAQTSGPLDNLFTGATARTRGLIDRSTEDFEAAIEKIVAGDMEGAYSSYVSAIQYRVIAMERYGTETDLYVMNTSGTDGMSSGWDTWSDKINQDRARIVKEREAQYTKYERIHSEALREILFGEDGPERAGRMKMHGKRLEAAGVIDIAVFGIPARNISQTFFNAEYSIAQHEIRELALNAAGAFKTNQPETGESFLVSARTKLESKQNTAETIGFVGNAGYTVAALGAMFIPVAGPWIGGTMIVGQQADHAYVEYHVEGAVSATSIAMIGLTVVTLGIGGAAGVLRTGSEALGVTATARTIAASRTLTFANLGIGIGMTGYMGHESYKAFQAGDIKNGLFTAGMALFPWLHMAGTGGYAVMRTRSAARANMEAVARELAPETRPVVEIDPTRVPESPRLAELSSPAKVLEFMRNYMIADAAGKGRMLAELPERVHGTIRSLADSTTIQNQLKGDPNVIDMNAGRELTDAIKLFGEEPTPPTPGGGGPRRTLSETEASGWAARREVLREFVGDLLSPEPQIQNCAQSRLARMRNENPEIAQIVDDLLRNPSVVQDVTTGARTPFSEKGFKTAQDKLNRLLPDDLVAQEQQAVEQYEVQAAVGYEGPLMMERPGQPMMGGRQPGEIGGTARPIEGIRTGPEIRNMADQPGGRPPVPASGVPSETGGPVAPRPLGDVAREAGRRVRDRVLPREPTGPTREELAAPKEYADPSADGLEVLCDRVTTLSERRAFAEGGGVPPEVRNAPQQIADIFKSLFERARNSRDRDHQNHARDLMAKLYVRGSVKKALDEIAGTDPVLRDALRQTQEALRSRAMQRDMSPARFEETYRGAKFDQTDIRVLSEILEAPGLEEVANAQTRKNGLVRELGKIEGRLPDGKEALAKADAKTRGKVVEEAREALAQAEGIAIQKYAEITSGLDGVERAINDPIAGEGEALARVREIARRNNVDIERELEGVERAINDPAAVGEALARLREAVERRSTGLMLKLNQIKLMLDHAVQIDFRSTETSRVYDRIRDLNRAFREGENRLRELTDTSGLRERITAWERGTGKSTREMNALGIDRGRITEGIARQQDIVDRYIPLANTEAVLGVNVPPAVKADMLLKLVETGKIPKGKVVDVRDSNVVQASRALDLLEMRDPSAAISAVRKELGKRLATGGGELDSILLETLRRPEVTEHLAPEARRELADARFDAGLETRAKKWNDAHPGEKQRTKEDIAFEYIREVDPRLGDFIDSTREHLTSNFSAVQKLHEVAERHISETRADVGAAIDVSTPADTFRRYYEGALGNIYRVPRWAVDVLSPIPLRGARIPYRLARTEGRLRFGLPERVHGRTWHEPGFERPGWFLRRGMGILDRTQSSEIRPRIWGYTLVALQLAIWGEEAYLGVTGGYRELYDWAKGTKSIEEGLALVRAKYGMIISEENAKFIRREKNGQEFIHSLRYEYPQDQPIEKDQPPRRKFPGQEALETALDNKRAFVHPRKLDEVLNEVRQIADELEDANENLAVMLKTPKDAEDETEEFSEFCTKWHIDYGEAIRRAERNLELGISGLTMNDIKELKMDDWIAKGYAFRINTAVVQQFFIDCGFEPEKALEISGQFLTEKGKEAYLKVWDLIQEGNVPVVYAQRAIEAVLLEKANLEAEADMPKAIMLLLTQQNLLVVDGMRKESALGWLDRHSMENEEKKALMLRVLGKPEYVTALNGMEIRGNEEILDIRGFEGWLARKLKTPSKVSLRDDAITEKVIGVPLIKGLSIEEGYSREMAEFIGKYPEISDWLSKKNKDYTIQIAEVVEFLKDRETGIPLNPKEMPNWLDEMIPTLLEYGLFVKRGEVITEEEARIDKAKLSGAVSRRVVVETEEKPKYPRNTEGGPGKIDEARLQVTDENIEEFMGENRQQGRGIRDAIDKVLNDPAEAKLVGAVTSKGFTNEGINNEVMRRIIFDLNKIKDGTANAGLVSKYSDAGITFVDETMTLDNDKIKSLIETHVRETLLGLAK